MPQRLSLGVVPPNTDIFFAVYNCPGKEDLSKSYFNPKRSLGAAIHIS